jgi:hypothetical protein
MIPAILGVLFLGAVGVIVVISFPSPVAVVEDDGDVEETKQPVSSTDRKKTKKQAESIDEELRKLRASDVE